MFSYIADTYEKLSEPEPAREYYLKKLELISESPSANTDVARLTEKAVVSESYRETLLRTGTTR